MCEFLKLLSQIILTLGLMGGFVYANYADVGMSALCFFFATFAFFCCVIIADDEEHKRRSAFFDK